MTWETLLSKSGTLNPRKHYITVNAEYGGVLTNRYVAIRLLVNGVPRSPHHHTPDIPNEYITYCTMFTVSPPSEGQCSIELQGRVEQTAQTLRVQNTALYVMQE